MILITGSSGFIGSALKQRLLHESYQIAEINSPNGGVCNTSIIESHEESGIKHVFHLAGKAFVPESWEKPGEYFNVNTGGTQNILDFCRKTGASLTFISSYLYGIPGELPISESHPVNPNNPYANTKFLAENLCRFYAQEYGVKVCILRPFNIFGPGQNDRMLIPLIIKQALNDDAISLKTLTPKRDFLFLDELINAILLTLKCQDNFSVYNVGSGKSYSVLEISEIILKVLGMDKPILGNREERKNEIPDVVADISKIQQELNWNIQYSLEEALDKTIANEQPAIR